VVSLFAFLPAAGMDKKEGEFRTFLILISFSFYSGFASDGKIVIWTPLAEEKTRILSQNTDWATSLSFSPDGRFLASADPDQKLIILSTEVNKKTERMKKEWL
jgi:WD40 repeat protein